MGNVHKPWTPEEEALLATMLAAGKSIALISARLKRRMNSVKAHANRRGLSVAQRPTLRGQSKNEDPVRT